MKMRRYLIDLRRYGDHDRAEPVVGAGSVL
jgi:hypothetical protein